MATTYSTSTRLGKPAASDRSWHLVLNANVDQVDALAPVGGLCVTTVETPSASLNVRVAAGAFATPWGSRVAYAGTSSQAVPASVTTYLWLTTAGVLTTGTGWPSTAHVPLASVVAAASAITSVADSRVVCATVVPGTQTVGGAATAGGSYTSAEQGMLNKCYTALRAAGLLT